MAAIKILIVEDEFIIAEDLKMLLINLGYEVTDIVKSYDQALTSMENNRPDLALVDILIKGSRDGIELAQTVKDNYDLPIIFLTSHSDKETVNRAKEVKPEGYLVKPFEKEDLYTSIEIAFSNYLNRKTEKTAGELTDKDDNLVFRNSIFVKKDHLLIKIRFDELIWIRAERNYLELHCHDKMHLIRSTMKDLIDKLPQDTFLQVHRSYAINMEHITAIEYTRIFLGKEEIPVGRSYVEIIKNKLKLDF